MCERVCACGCLRVGVCVGVSHVLALFSLPATNVCIQQVEWRHVCCLGRPHPPLSSLSGHLTRTALDTRSGYTVLRHCPSICLCLCAIGSVIQQYVDTFQDDAVEDQEFEARMLAGFRQQDPSNHIRNYVRVCVSERVQVGVWVRALHFLQPHHLLFASLSPFSIFARV